MDRDGREMGERWEGVGAFEYTHIFEYTYIHHAQVCIGRKIEMGEMEQGL